MEMASLDLMPHSIQLFLDQVSLQLWDRTVFWHQEGHGVDHVVSAAAVMYTTGEPRQHHFDALGAAKLSFVEYDHHNNLPHEQYTVGYANKGPEFYINTRNNTLLHGGFLPHLQPKPDPCFAKIIEGFDVIDRMYERSIRQSKQTAQRRVWDDNELTHILKAEILP